MALPLLGLWLLLANPDLDVRWEHHQAHFWLVLVVAAVNVALGGLIARESARHDDARLFLVSMTFLTAAGFLGLHALATPGIVVEGRNAGFVLATPIGLVLAAVFAVVSAQEFSPQAAQTVLAKKRVISAAVVGLLVAWGIVSALALPPLRDPLDVAGAARWPLTVFATVGVVLYLVAAAGYLRIHRRRPAVLLISLITAFVLLAESLVTVILARSWHASWWQWHVLMAFAFVFVAYSAHVRYRLEGTSTGLFKSIALDASLRTIREEHAKALETLTTAMRRAADEGSEESVGPLAHRLAERFGLTEGQTDVLEEAASSLAAERELIRRLGALVSLGGETRVIIDEEPLLERAISLIGDAFGRDAVRIGVVEEGVIRSVSGDGAISSQAAKAIDTVRTVEYPADGANAIALPLVAKGHGAGVLEVRRAKGTFADRDRWLLESLSSQLGIALENTRLYAQLDGLFRQYVSPDIATELIADPAQAALGGRVIEVTVLFADLKGFTSLSERASPPDVVELLNRYFAAAAPEVLAHGGTLLQYAGDLLMAVWNAPVRQADHALLAARAGLGLQRAVTAVASPEPDAPRFRVGINTGPALVGNIGSAEVRAYTVIGDPVNLASRLEGLAEPGQVVIGSATYEAIGDLADVEPLGPVTVKGKSAPVDAYVLVGLR